MHYRYLKESRSEAHPGALHCLPDQGLALSSAHGSLLYPLKSAKLAASGSSEHSAVRTPPKYLLSKDPLPTSSTNTEEPPEPATAAASTIASTPAKSCDASTITDVSNSGNVAEVEIISLLAEQLPRYTLRADTMYGYDHDDWLHTPLLPPEVPLNLTPEQIEETFKYFLLCSERVGLVTRTYHDIDAVTNLLEEKERDLELAARIGQSLLKQNRSLTERNEFLEEQLELAQEEIAQLHHEVSRRDMLLHLYTNSTEESEPTSSSTTPLRRNESSFSVQHCFQLETLQQKLKGLEDENLKLRSETNTIVTETCQFEDQEELLMMECVEQFSEASREVGLLAEKLAQRGEDNNRQKEEISKLLAQIVDLQHKCRSCSSDNEELQQHLTEEKEIQRRLRTELRDLHDKYIESNNMLHEAIEEMKNLRNRELPNTTINRFGPLNIVPLDSIAAEIEGTMRKGFDPSKHSECKNFLRAFETVKVINQASRSCSQSRAQSRAHSPQNLSMEMYPALPSYTSTPRTSYYGSDTTSTTAPEERVQALEPAPLKSECQEKKLGKPGTPGSQDLVAALQRLSMGQGRHSPEDPLFEAETTFTENSSGFLTPNESILSTGTNYSGSSDHTGGSSLSFSSRSYLPEKLQIVKPMEGSVTLHHWQQLAKPNLGGILDPRPGVLTKDFRQLDVDLEEVYNLNDFEEDEVDLTSFQALATSTPSKAKENISMLHSTNNLPQTQSTYTVTTCRILHQAKDNTTVTPSLYNSLLPSCGDFESLRSAARDSQQLLPEYVTGVGRPSISQSAPFGLVTLVKEHGISAAICPTFRNGLMSGATQPGGTSSEPPTSYPTFYLGGEWKPLPVQTLGGFHFSKSLLGNMRLDDRTSKRHARSLSQNSIFSINLVDKLKRLRLNSVVERGEASFQKATESKTSWDTD
ncbi:huntingtin-associated protein 1 isoform X1 [Pleurodeles waltl]|uniref:huntingtin-associated protein 1 isoform X1 n=1 Tax=Pleurodeles waltl TaxID=8319 RepID=UPI0037095744